MQSPASRPKAARVLVTAESIGGRRDRRLQDHPAPRGRAQAGKALLDRIRCGVGDARGERAVRPRNRGYLGCPRRAERDVLDGFL